MEVKVEKFCVLLSELLDKKVIDGVSEVSMHSAVSVLLLNSFVLPLSYPDLAAAIQIYTFRIKYKPLKIQNRSCIKIVLSMSAGSESRKCHNPS